MDSTGGILESEKSASLSLAFRKWAAGAFFLERRSADIIAGTSSRFFETTASFSLFVSTSQEGQRFHPGVEPPIALCSRSAASAGSCDSGLSIWVGCNQKGRLSTVLGSHHPLCLKGSLHSS